MVLKGRTPGVGTVCVFICLLGSKIESLTANLKMNVKPCIYLYVLAFTQKKIYVLAKPAVLYACKTSQAHVQYIPKSHML